MVDEDQKVQVYAFPLENTTNYVWRGLNDWRLKKEFFIIIT